METAETKQDGAVVVSVRHWRSWPEISNEWAVLGARSGASFFLSNHWVTTWLDVFGVELQPEILVFRLREELVGICLLVRRVQWQKFVPLKRVYLNCAGESETDDTCIEYNRLLCLPGCERDVAAALHGHLQKQSWDELILPGLEPSDATGDLCEGAYQLQVNAKSSWYVDLAAVRSEGGGYEKILSAKTRKMIRQSVRKYETIAGPLTLERADSAADALRFLEELAELHQKTWTERGKPGVFSSAKFRAFHQQLIERAFPDGQIELVRVLAGGQTIGVLYSFLYDGRIYFYQCGFAYENDRNLSPGSVSHLVAIQHYLERPDVLEYDFLAGNAPYKRSLGKSQRSLEWRVVQRPTLRVKTVAALRGLKNAYQAARKKAAGSREPAETERPVAEADS